MAGRAFARGEDQGSMFGSEGDLLRGNPITSFNPRGKGWAEVAEGVQAAAAAIQAK